MRTSLVDEWRPDTPLCLLREHQMDGASTTDELPPLKLVFNPRSVLKIRKVPAQRPSRTPSRVSSGN
jgi:hypothetical protein